MTDHIEDKLRQLPKFTMDTQYRQSLASVLINKYTEKGARSRFVIPRFAYVLCALVLLLGGYFFAVKGKGNPFVPTVVHAADIIRKNLESHMKVGTIYHVVYTHDIYDNGEQASATYDLWEDYGTTARFKQDIIYPDGSHGQQGFDLDIRWDTDFATKTVKRDIYIYPSGAQKEALMGQRTDIATDMKAMVDAGTVTAVPGKLDTKDVYIVTNTDDHVGSGWDVLTFDRETFALLRVEENGDSGTRQTITYDLQESIERTSERLQDVFGFVSPGSDFKVLDRRFDTSKGYLDDDYYEVSTASAVPAILPQTPMEYLESTPSADGFQCPRNTWIYCKTAGANCSQDYLSWAGANCPNFKGASF